MSDVLASYKNGNYNVVLFEDGTKVRYNKLDNLVPDFAESIDCNITYKCDGGCEFCYLGCTPMGKHADLSQPFFDTLHSGQELALNGNDLSHPDLESFLVRMKDQGVICNITVNQMHFIKHINKIRHLVNNGLVCGIGVSLSDSSDKMLYKYIEEFPNVVVHVIDGLLTQYDIDNLSNKNLKLLILGYKVLGRGDNFYFEHKREILSNISYLRDNLNEMCNKFDVISFDNLAIKHIELQKHFDNDDWMYSYMGDDGEFTFYIDAVNKKFSTSSMSYDRWDLLDNVDDMFKVVREKRNG